MTSQPKWNNASKNGIGSMLRNERLLILLNIFKRRRPFWYTENLRMYSKSSTTINIKHILSLLTNLYGQYVYIMRIKGRPKAAEIRAACHLWKKRSWGDPVSQLEKLH